MKVASLEGNLFIEEAIVVLGPGRVWVGDASSTRGTSGWAAL